MKATDILASLGFDKATIISDNRGKIVVRVRTSQGWVYEKFDPANLREQIEAWAVGRSPE